MQDECGARRFFHPNFNNPPWVSAVIRAEGPSDACKKMTANQRWLGRKEQLHGNKTENQESLH